MKTSHVSLRKRYLLCAVTLVVVVCSQASVVDTARTYHIEEVVVTGSNHTIRRDLLPYTVSIVDNDQLEATGRSQLLSVISVQVPGLFVSERNILGFGVSYGGSGGIKIRGVGGSPTNAVLMMVDGQPQFAGIYSHHVADFYETEYVDHVEILRGPASVLYGSNAMGGAINIITKNSSDGIYTSLSSEYGSYNTWQTAFTNTTRFGRFSSLISLEYDRTDGLEDNFDFKRGNIYAKLGYDFSHQWQLKVDYSLMNFIGNDPIYSRLDDPTSIDIYHQNIIRGETSASLTNHYHRTDGNVRMYYSYGNHYIDEPSHFHSVDDRFGILAYQNFRPWANAFATIGFDFDTYAGKIPISESKQHTEGSLTTISRKSTTEYSPYVTLSQHLFNGVLILNIGLRMANSNRFGTQWIPQGGFVVHPSESWLIKASLAKGYRNPSFREMYLYRPANPDLVPENMMNYEITLSKSFSRYFNIDVTGYYSKGNNLIQTIDMKNVNTGSFINKGIELSVNSRPTDKLTLRATYSYLHTSIDNLTAAPMNQYFLSANWQALSKLDIDAELRGVGGLYVSDDTKQQNYALLNIKLSYQTFRFLNLFVTLDNITNAHYTINRGYEMPGFTIVGGFKLYIPDRFPLTRN